MIGTKRIPMTTLISNLVAIMIRKIRKPTVWIPLLIILYVIADYCGVFIKLKELDYETKFAYPLEGNIELWVSQMKNGEKPSVEQANKHSYIITKGAKGKCLEEDGNHYVKLRLVYIVKSALENFERRKVIRRTWGYERRFSDVNIRTVFLLGRDPDYNVEKQLRIEEESKEFGDIVQGDFIDNYYNNTIKTMMGLRWAAEQCPTSRFYFFVDDDFYVSTRNALRFLRNPINFPKYLDEPVLSFDEEEPQSFRKRKLHQLVDFDLPEDVILYAGIVMNKAPMRMKFSKWYIPLEDYPFDMYP